MFNIMGFAKFIIAATLATTSTAYVINAYYGTNCEGDIAHESFNVWNGTCATPHPGWQSFKVNVTGGHDQKATMFSKNACVGRNVFGHISADGSSKCFQPGYCFNMAGPANAAGSRFDAYQASDAVATGSDHCDSSFCADPICDS